MRLQPIVSFWPTSNGNPLLDAFRSPMEEIDFDHRSPAFLSASPTATAAVADDRSGSSMPSFFQSSAIFRNGSKHLDRRAKPLLERLGEAIDRSGAAAQKDAVDRSDAAVALKKSNVFWISSSTFSVIACKHRTDIVECDAPIPVRPSSPARRRSKVRSARFCSASV